MGREKEVVDKSAIAVAHFKVADEFSSFVELAVVQVFELSLAYDMAGFIST